MKMNLLFAGICLSLGASTVLANVTLPVVQGSSGRVMSSTGPAHLGTGGNIGGVIDLNDIGDAIVGDGGPVNNFSLILGFNTTADFRSAVANGAPVVLTGSTLFGIDDGFGGVDQKTIGNVDWAPVSASVNGYGSSVTGTFSDANNFRRHAAFNLGDTSATSTNAYTLVGALDFATDPYTGSTTFSIDLTSALAGLPLDSDNDRIMIGLSAWAFDNGTLIVNNGNGNPDRIAFVGSSFELTAIPEPSTYAALFGVLAVAFVAWRRRRC